MVKELEEEKVESLEPVLSSEELVNWKLEIRLPRSAGVDREGVAELVLPGENSDWSRPSCCLPAESSNSFSLLLKVKALLSAGGVVNLLGGVLSGLLEECSLSFRLATIPKEACPAKMGGAWGEVERALVVTTAIGWVLSSAEGLFTSVLSVFACGFAVDMEFPPPALVPCVGC